MPSNLPATKEKGMNQNVDPKLVRQITKEEVKKALEEVKNQPLQILPIPAMQPGTRGFEERERQNAIQVLARQHVAQCREILIDLGEVQGDGEPDRKYLLEYAVDHLEAFMEPIPEDIEKEVKRIVSGR
jgi:hypothetical protein